MLKCGLTRSHDGSRPSSQTNGFQRPSPLCLLVDAAPKLFHSHEYSVATFPVVVPPYRCLQLELSSFSFNRSITLLTERLAKNKTVQC